MTSLEPRLRAIEAPGADPTRFVYAGIAFDVSPAPGVVFALDADHRRCCAPFEAGPVAASVRVAVSTASELASDPDERSIRVAWTRNAAEVHARGLRAELRELGPGRFVASALVAPGAPGGSALGTALASAALDRVGGVVLHASGVDLDGSAILFVGPSTAGKTTAAGLCAGGAAFARDRAALYPSPAGWYAAPMSGGTRPVALPASSARVLPVGAVLRVVKDVETRISDEPAAAGVARLRESVMATDRGVAGEQALLERLARLAAEARIGTAHTVLGEPLTGRLRAHLGAGA